MVARRLSGFEHPNRLGPNRIEAIAISVMEQVGLLFHEFKPCTLNFIAL
jgi:hypothetical protein